MFVSSPVKVNGFLFSAISGTFNLHLMQVSREWITLYRTKYQITENAFFLTVTDQKYPKTRKTYCCNGIRNVNVV